MPKPTTTLDVGPAISGFRAAIDGVVQAELKRFQSRLRSLTPGQQQLIELSMREIGIKILDPVIRSLKRAAQRGDWQGIVRLCELFDVVPLPHMVDRCE
jgi:glutamyl-tRNA reductase